MSYEIHQASPAPAAFTRRPRGGGVDGIHQIQIHATRGAYAYERQYFGTIDWFAHQADRGGWGSSADFVVGPDHRDGNAISITQFKDWRTTYSSWSAGFGARGSAYEWGAAEVGVAIEVAQPARWDGNQYVGGDSDHPFAPELVEAVVWLCDHINDELESAGGNPIPAVHIPYWDQLRSKAIPRGYIGHDDLANGQRLGKTDPGAMWDWDAFLAQVGAVDEHELPPPLSNYDAGVAAWTNGVRPLVRTVEQDIYELRVRR